MGAAIVIVIIIVLIYAFGYSDGSKRRNENYEEKIIYLNDRLRDLSVDFEEKIIKIEYSIEHKVQERVRHLLACEMSGKELQKYLEEQSQPQPMNGASQETPNSSNQS